METRAHAEAGARRWARTGNPPAARIPAPVPAQASGWSYWLCQLAVALDAITTWLGVRAGASELHPLWGGLIDRFGIDTAMAVRLTVGGLIIGGLYWAIPRVRGLTPRSLWRIGVVFAAVSCWNLLALLTA